MNKELINRLLKTKTLTEFMIEILKEETQYMVERDLWDGKVIEHLLKLSDMTLEEFNNGCSVNGRKGFFIDDFNEGD